MSDRDSRYSKEHSPALPERRARVREEEARVAAAEGPLARLGEIARARATARSPRPRVGPSQESALRGPQVEVAEQPDQPTSEPDVLEESEDSLEDVDAVTEQIALQQEVEVLRRVLLEKERIVDSTAEKCRSLEDALEDQHLAYEGLMQELERKTLMLRTERGRAARLSQERDDIEKRYEVPASSNDHEEVTEGSADKPDSSSSAGRRFLGGMAVGALLAAIAFGVWVQLYPLSAHDRVSSQGQQAALATASKSSASVAGVPAQSGPAAAALYGSESRAGSETQGGGSRSAKDEEGGTPRPAVVGTLRDRLRNGSNGPLMVRLAGGDFTMGKQRALPDADEGPAHPVHLKGFLIGATEVTFDEYDRFVRATGRRLPSDFGWGRGRRPVVDVSWDDASAYAKWLSAQSKRRYRLPSEAEWEYAAAAGARSSYWWGYQLGQNRAVCFDCGSRWDNLSTAPVETFDPNPIGLYNTAGNVMEWVQDCHHPNYTGAPANGQPWVGGSCQFRVARGGAFNKPARSMRTTVRHRFVPKTRINSLGFRLARDG